MPESAELTAIPPDPGRYRHTRRIDAVLLPVKSRKLFPNRHSRNAIENACATVWPWSYQQYPGVQRLRAWLMGMTNVESAAAYCKRVEVPKVRLRIAAGKLRAMASSLIASADALDRLAGDGGQKLGPSSEGKLSKVRPSAVPPPVVD